jgi:hypothetical protein
LGQPLDIVLKIATLASIACGGLWFLASHWQPIRRGWSKFWARFWGWLYSHTTRYQIKQLQTQVDGLARLSALETARKDAEIQNLHDQHAAFRKSVTEALWKVLAVQTNTDRFLDNHTSIVELMAMLDQMAAQPAQREDVDTLRAQVAALVALQAKFLRGTMDRSPEAAVILTADREAKERANTPD